MSQQKAQYVDPAILLAQAQELQRYIAGIQSAIAELEGVRINTEKAIETIKAVSEAEGEVLAPADPLGTAYYWTRPSEKDKYLVHLGLDIYVAVPKEKAVELLEKRLTAVMKDMGILRRRLEEATAQYNAIQEVLQRIMQQAQARQAQQAGKQ